MTKTIITQAKQFKSENFKLADNVKVNKYQGKSIYASYNGAPIRLQLPKMSLPFGVSKYSNPDSPEDVKYTLELSCKDLDPKFLQELNALEDLAIDYVEKNSKTLFKKQRSKDVLKEMYKSFIKFDEVDGERSDRYPPRLKVKMWTNGKDFTANAYDSEKVNGQYPKVKLTVDNIDDYLSKGSSCETIIQCSGVWCMDAGFGFSWSVVQMKVYKNEDILSGYAFAEEPEEVIEENLFDNDEEQEEVVVVEEPPKRVRRKKEEF